MEPNRRVNDQLIIEKIGHLSEKFDDLKELLLGNGQPGFINKTRHDLNNLKQWQVTWQEVSETKEKLEEKNRKNFLALVAIIGSGCGAVVHFFIDWFRRSN